MITVVVKPCASCPYRQDVPPGLWSDDEYAKLPPYDWETWEQPTALFHCHTQPRMLCAGWVGCHDMQENLAVRLHSAQLNMPFVMAYESPVPLFASGAEAAEHGVQPPDERASRMINKLIKVVARRKT